MKNLTLNDHIEWIIGADEHGQEGPLHTGKVYAMHAKGRHPYWVPFLMALEDKPEVPTMNSIMNPPLRIAVNLNNPTLRKIDD